MSQDIIINTAKTLSLMSVPGQDKRFPSVSTESFHSFGDFRMQRNISFNILSSDTRQFSFSNFSTLNSLSSSRFDPTVVTNITTNDLNPLKNDANSYAYFGSFYDKVVSGVNNIIENFPYAIYFYALGTGATVLNYTNTWSGTSIFDLQLSAITNQGDIIYSSGITSSDTRINLFYNYQDFEVELKSSGNYQNSYAIRSYTHNSNTNVLHFEINGYLFSANTASTTVGLYIKPSEKRYQQYKRSLSNLENQILFEQKFLVPNPDDDTFENQSFIWPKSIDGFNPDISGSQFSQYLTSLLNSCRAVDEIKTNWMVRTMLPENYIELDSNLEDRISDPTSTQPGIYQTITSVYAQELDKIKQYIDGLAFSYSVNYHDQETIPNKFMHRLSTLLGWEAVNEFNDSDIFEYLAKEDENGYTHSDYNFDLWKKILININWLYKRKGTRDALQFIFKLMGAPDCLVNFNETVYKITQSLSASTTSIKVADDGYPNYDLSSYEFQEGGEGRGSGDRYISQWEPEFNPIKEVDNIKIYTGDTSVNGTANVMNSKQLNIQLSPAAAIECDVKKWYDLGYLNGTSTTNAQANIPSWIDLAAIRTNLPPSVSAMTVTEWMDYAYTHSINPTTRKIYSQQSGHNYFYNNLRDLYLSYYYWTRSNEISNQLNFRKLESFLELIQRNFDVYIARLIPATTILEGEGVLYRNTVFNTQKFVYPPGINSGSEFKIKAPKSPRLSINSFVVHSSVNQNTHANISSVNISSNVNKNYNANISSVGVVNNFTSGIVLSIHAVSVNSIINSATTVNYNMLSEIQGKVITFPVDGIPSAQPSPVPRPYRTKTRNDIDSEPVLFNPNDIQD